MSHDGYRGKYDPADFFVPPSVDKGTSEQVQLRIQSGHYRALNIVSRCGLFPFQERNDVIRWCVKFGLEHIGKLEKPLLTTHLIQAEMLIATAQEDIRLMELKKTIEELRKALTVLEMSGDRASQRELVEKYRRLIESMPEEPERELRWKLKYLDALEQYRHYEAIEGSVNTTKGLLGS